jgi:hypothetical protein
MKDTKIGCIAQIVVITLWGFLGSWFTGIFLDMWFAEHTWFELSLLTRWFIGVFVGKFALLGIIIGLIAGTVATMPIF